MSIFDGKGWRVVREGDAVSVHFFHDTCVSERDADEVYSKTAAGDWVDSAGAVVDADDAALLEEQVNPPAPVLPGPAQPEPAPADTSTPVDPAPADPAATPAQ